MYPSQNEERLKKERYLRVQESKAVLLGFGAVFLLEAIVLIHGRAWLFFFAWTWPTALPLTLVVVYAFGILATFLVVFGVWTQFREHAHCRRNRWKYECAVQHLLETVFHVAWQIAALPVLVVLWTGRLFFWEVPFCAKEFVSFLREYRRSKSSSPTASS